MTNDAKEDRRPWWLQFILPKITPAFLLRLACLALAAWIFFSRFCIPARVYGNSMLPNYTTGQWLFCWTTAFRKRPPMPGDVVMIEYSGHGVMLLKRVVAVEGDTLQFIAGKLIVNGRERTENWANATPCDWEAPPVTVRKGCVYVVGDNRQMPKEEHLHGEVECASIVGAPLWNRGHDSSDDTAQ